MEIKEIVEWLFKIGVIVLLIANLVCSSMTYDTVSLYEIDKTEYCNE